MESLPSINQLSDLYRDLSLNLKKQCTQKLNESNKMKSNFANPHLKTILISDTHRLFFAGAFGRKFTTSEMSLAGVNIERNSPVYSLSKITRVREVFGDDFLKIHSSGDISFVTPWYVVEEPTRPSWLTKGALIIPISAIGDNIECFVPCPGLNPETDSVDDWVQDIKLKDIFKGLKREKLSKVQGDGKISIINKTDYASILPGQVCEGDFIYVRGEYYEVFAHTEDAFSPIGTKEVVRFRTNAKKNVNNQRFEIVRWPSLQGKILKLPSSSVKLDTPVSIELEKINELNIGTLKIKYKNACFNSMGFLTHDSHVL